MDKRGTLFFRLLTGLFGALFLLWGSCRLLKPSASYELQSAQICEVGDGMTVSGFVVRYESPIYCEEAVSLIPPEGAWVGGGHTVASISQGTLKTPVSGYLSHWADGYEECLTPDFVKTASPEELFSLTPSPVSARIRGKLITSQIWYFAAPAQEGFSVGQRLSLRIGEVETRGKVIRNDGLLLLECNRHLYALTQIRETEAELTGPSLRAIPLPDRALYYEEGTSCVYILQGGRVRRKAVEVIGLKGEEVLLHEDSLPVGAQVIITDIELTDGMILK